MMNFDDILKGLDDLLEKSRAKQLQNKHSGSNWKTINGAKVLIGGDGKIIAGAGGNISKDDKTDKGDKINVSDQIEHYKTLTHKEKEKYQQELMDFSMDLMTRIKDKNNSEGAKKVYKVQLDANNKIFEEIRDLPTKLTHELPEKDFRDSVDNFGMKIGMQIDNWTEQAKNSIGEGKGKLFKNKQEAINDIEKQIKTLKYIENFTRARMLGSVIKNLNK